LRLPSPIICLAICVSTNVSFCRAGLGSAAMQNSLSRLAWLESIHPTLGILSLGPLPVPKTPAKQTNLDGSSRDDERRMFMATTTMMMMSHDGNYVVSFR